MGDVAVEDVNLLLSDLDLRVAGHQAEDTTLGKSSDVVVKQVLALEQALAMGDGEVAAAEKTNTDDARGIVDAAIARGMPRPPAGRTDDPTARCGAVCRLSITSISVCCFRLVVGPVAAIIDTTLKLGCRPGGSVGTSKPY